MLTDRYFKINNIQLAVNLGINFHQYWSLTKKNFVSNIILSAIFFIKLEIKWFSFLFKMVSINYLYLY